MNSANMFIRVKSSIISTIFTGRNVRSKCLEVIILHKSLQAQKSLVNHSIIENFS